MNPLKLDPTRTTLLRKQYSMEMRRRFLALLDKVVEAIGELDALGLDETKPMAFNQAILLNQMPFRQAWRFLTDAQKLDAFNAWFVEQVEAGILEVDHKGDPWTSKYVYSAYKKGSLRAYADTHKEQMLEKVDFYQGKRAQFLESAFNQPERLSKLQFLYTRSYEELKGITATMSQQIGRILADGIATGRSPRTLASDLANGITGITKQRAQVMARTEIIAAHSEGQLDAFAEMGVENIEVMAEWSTAGDDLVCEKCAALDGVVMIVDEARGLIPRHPNCRCAWIPANVGEKSKNQINRGVQGGIIPQAVMDSYNNLRERADAAKVSGDSESYEKLNALVKKEANKVQEIYNLSKEEAGLIEKWGGWDGTKKIKEAYKQDTALMGDFEAVLDKMPVYRGITYSGMGDVPEDILKTLTQVGNEYVLSVPFSSSTREGIAARYLGMKTGLPSESKRVVSSLMVKIKAKSAVDVSWYSSKKWGTQYQDLREVILRPGSKYVVEYVGPIEHSFPYDPEWVVQEIVLKEI